MCASVEIIIDMRRTNQYTAEFRDVRFSQHPLLQLLLILLLSERSKEYALTYYITSGIYNNHGWII